MTTKPTPVHGEPKVPVRLVEAKETDTDVNPVVPPGEVTKTDLDAVKELAQAHDQIVNEISKRIIGQRRVIEQLLVALFARGHTLFVGVPGLAKTR